MFSVNVMACKEWVLTYRAIFDLILIVVLVPTWMECKCGCK